MSSERPRDDHPENGNSAGTVPFGYRKVSAEEKKRLVRAQFDPIATTYDLADRLFSAGLDTTWRKKSIRWLGLEPGDRVLDVCGGTADLAILAAKKIRPDGLAIVYDFCLPMIEAGRKKTRKKNMRNSVLFVQGDAEKLSFPGEFFDAITVGFGIRNLARIDEGLREMHRVLKPNGRLLVLEFSLPAGKLRRLLYGFYSFKVMPFAGKLICGTGEPFRYLAESIRIFPPPEQVACAIREAGFADVSFRRLSNGIAVAYLAQKPECPY